MWNASCLPPQVGDSRSLYNPTLLWKRLLATLVTWRILAVDDDAELARQMADPEKEKAALKQESPGVVGHVAVAFVRQNRGQ